MARQWRCFFCDEVFKRREEAAEHFGLFDSCEADVPACKIKDHEGHLVKYIRKLEAQVRRHMHEDSDVLRSIMTLEADHRQALQTAEEEGYARGLRDAKRRKSVVLTDRRAILIALRLAIDTEDGIVDAYHNNDKEQAVRDAKKNIAAFRRVLNRYYGGDRRHDPFAGANLVDVLQVAPRDGLEPPTTPLTAERSTN